MKADTDRPLSFAFSDGTLNKLVVSYSREEATTEVTKYVHHLMRAHGRELCELLLVQNARIFVCG